MAVFLELDESQLEALGMMQRDNAQALLPLVRSVGETQGLLQEALAADAPDETTVGRLILASRGLQQEAGMLRQSQLEAAPDALNLSPEQREKLQLLQTSLRVAPIAQIAAGLNLIRGPALGALFVQGDFSAPFPATPFGGIPGRTGDRGGDREMQGLTPAELEMTLEFLESEVDRIGQNVDRVSQRLSIRSVPRAE